MRPQISYRINKPPTQSGQAAQKKKLLKLKSEWHTHGHRSRMGWAIAQSLIVRTTVTESKLA